MKQFLIALLAFGVVACSGQQPSSNAPAASPMESPAAMPAATSMATTAAMAMQSLTVAIHPLNGSGESGTATLTAMGAAQTRVVIALKGESAKAMQPAHIHLGSCAKLNPAPKYPLKDVVGGASTSVVAASFAALTAGGMAINVHASAANIAKYVACGDIKAKMAM